MGAQHKHATWVLGTTIGGSYRLDALLGAGGFGAVFRAVHVRQGHVVALKLLSREAMIQADSIPRFQREARVAMTLKHPSTVRVLDLGDAGEGTPFIAFELLEGMSLEQRLRGGPLPIEEATRIAVDLLGSLEEAHQQQIVHRDVKPANIFLCKEPAGLVKLLDFGVAKEGSTLQKLTAEGFMVGTPAYMAPEQLSSQPVGPATDLFALGLVLAEMLTAEPVYKGEALTICVEKVRGTPAALGDPRIPISLLAVLKRATAPQPSNRYRSADEMRRAVLDAGYLNQRPSQLPQPPSGKFGTMVMDLPKSAPPSKVSALAATAPPSLQTPLAIGRASTNPMAATAPPSLHTPLAASPLSSPLSSTTPLAKKPSLAATTPDDSLRRPRIVPHLAATVDHNPRVMPQTLAIVPSPAPERRSRIVWVLLGLLLLLGGAAVLAWRLGVLRLLRP